MPAVRLLPDIEAIAAVAIRNANLSGLGSRVYSSVPATPTFPLVVVRRVGGLPAVRQYLDAGVVEVAVWGTTKSEAHDLAQRARVELLELEATTITTPVTAYVTAVDDWQGLTWEPDTLTGRDRYVFSMRIYARST